VRGGVELDSFGKQCCLVKALKALCLAFSRHGLRPTPSTAARSRSRAVSFGARSRDRDASSASRATVTTEARMKTSPHCCWSWMVELKTVMWSEEEYRATRPSTMPPVVWGRPSRSRLRRQWRGDEADSGGAGGSALPDGGPAALEGGDTKQGWSREIWGHLFNATPVTAQSWDARGDVPSAQAPPRSLGSLANGQSPVACGMAARWQCVNPATESLITPAK